MSATDIRRTDGFTMLEVAVVIALMFGVLITLWATFGSKISGSESIKQQKINHILSAALVVEAATLTTMSLEIPSSPADYIESQLKSWGETRILNPLQIEGVEVRVGLSAFMCKSPAAVTIASDAQGNAALPVGCTLIETVCIPSGTCPSIITPDLLQPFVGVNLPVASRAVFYTAAILDQESGQTLPNNSIIRIARAGKPIPLAGVTPVVGGFPTLPPEITPPPIPSLTPENTLPPVVSPTPESTSTPEFTLTPESTPTLESTLTPESSPTPIDTPPTEQETPTPPPEDTPIPEDTIVPEPATSPEPELSPSPQGSFSP